MCTTVIVGKNVSKTGRVIVGHNEDAGGRTLHQQFYCPAGRHIPGEREPQSPGAKAFSEKMSAFLPKVETYFKETPTFTMQ